MIDKRKHYIVYIIQKYIKIGVGRNEISSIRKGGRAVREHRT